MKYYKLNFSRNKADMLFYVSHNYEIHTFFRTVREKIYTFLPYNIYVPTTDMFIL